MKTTEKQTEGIPRELFDGFAVFEELRTVESAAGRTSAENVSDTLDAVVRLLRKRAAIAKAVGGGR